MKDVTNLVEFNLNDDECLPITKCVCGTKYEAWKFYISVYSDTAYKCPACHRKLFFRPEIRVYEVEDEY